MLICVYTEKEKKTGSIQSQRNAYSQRLVMSGAGCFAHLKLYCCHNTTYLSTVFLIYIYLP